jgi:chorismate-pyruvate lyase
MSHQETLVDLPTLTALFYPNAEQLGSLEETPVKQLPWNYQVLLAHYNHMTVAVELFHHSPVDVVVLEKVITEDSYARKILLKRRSDGRVVQYGIMRVRFDHLNDRVRRQIESEDIPLGRVFVENNVHREVELISLWKVTPGDELRELLDMQPGQITYGRTAMIHVDKEPAVELLEIVAPVEE